MNTVSKWGVSALAFASLGAPALSNEHMAAAPEPDALQDVILVTGYSDNSANLLASRPDALPDTAPDAAGLLARLPGVALIDNGGLSGQVQYRGLFGPRINLRVDGMSFASGGPNLMDPPLHYAPPVLIDHISMDRGVSPVRFGPGLGGGADAVLKRVDYTDASDWRTAYDLSATYRSADSSTAVGGVAGVSNDQFRLHVLGSHEEGNDLSYPDGDIRASSHERKVYGLGAGAKIGAHEFALDLRRQETEPTGNPPYPMDIKYFDTDFARASYHGVYGDVHVRSNVAYVDVSHLMTNFHLRPAPANPMMWRQNHADATTLSGDASVQLPFGAGDLTVGLDAERNDKNAIISHPNNAAFFLASLPKIEAERLGGFAEWTGVLWRHNAELGVRVDSYDKTAGEASTGAAVPMGPTNLANVYNASDRSWDATALDLSARVWRDFNGGTLRAVLARKQRAPGYVEIFSWLPTGASGGLADGNIYVGNQELELETAWIAELGMDWANDRAYARPTLWYRSVDDFITGAPFDHTVGVIDSPVEMIANMNGDSTPLSWANVDARIYGFDMDAGVNLAAHWRLDGTLSWQKGERRDIDDPLYRIAPPNASLAITHDQDIWSASLETVAYAEQKDVSQTNSEEETPGYVIVNIAGDWRIQDGVKLSFGIENVLDQTWRDHLGGYNRVQQSDVLVGQRLPGAGRNAFVRLSLSS